MNKYNKIVFLLPNLRAAGVEKAIITLANEMSRLGHSVSILVFENNGELTTTICEEIEIIDLKVKRSLFSTFKLIQFFKKNKVNLISSYNYISVFTIMANLITLKKSKVFVCEHTTLSQMNKTKPNYKAKIVTFLMKLLYPLANGIIAVSYGVADDLSKTLNISRKKIQVLYNPVNIELIHQMAQEKANHNWLINKTRPVILAIGRLDIAKNFTLLINAFVKTADQADAKLLILGEGSLRTELEQQIKKLKLSKKCELAGYTPNPYSDLKAADLLVLSSDVEGFALVLVEALALNIPVISTDCPSGPSEILEDGKWGTLVPMNDVDTLANAILEQLKKPPTNNNLRARAKFFDVGPTTQRYIDYIFNQD